MPKEESPGRRGMRPAFASSRPHSRSRKADKDVRKILILGAGRSASSLIHYLITHADQQEWRITVADKDRAQADRLVQEGPEVAKGIALDASDAQTRAALIAKVAALVAQHYKE